MQGEVNTKARKGERKKILKCIMSSNYIIQNKGNIFINLIMSGLFLLMC